MNPHDLEQGGHVPFDVDPFIPTGQCAVCEGMSIDERLPEDRTPDNPYDSSTDESPTAEEALK
jgi:hypothetical protein